MNSFDSYRVISSRSSRSKILQTAAAWRYSCGGCLSIRSRRYANHQHLLYRTQRATAIVISSFCPSVRPSVRHALALC